jgi:hypothetical protein
MDAMGAEEKDSAIETQGKDLEATAQSKMRSQAWEDGLCHRG